MELLGLNLEFVPSLVTWRTWGRILIWVGCFAPYSFTKIRGSTKGPRNFTKRKFCLIENGDWKIGLRKCLKGKQIWFLLWEKQNELKPPTYFSVMFRMPSTFFWVESLSLGWNMLANTWYWIVLSLFFVWFLQKPLVPGLLWSCFPVQADNAFVDGMF